MRTTPTGLGLARQGCVGLPREIWPGRCWLKTRRCTQRQYLSLVALPGRIFEYCLAEAAAKFGVQLTAALQKFRIAYRDARKALWERGARRGLRRRHAVDAFTRRGLRTVPGAGVDGARDAGSLDELVEEA